jgi:peptidoglycan/LPS O-acetylase OafA/YrhL
VTLVVNFLAGSFLYITVPSFVIPGIGALTAAWRGLMWGIILAPTFAQLASGMLPHSWTLLVEGEGYILAAFFALLVPDYMCRSRMGGGVLNRYGRALLLNAQGALLTFIVLAVAASYEAVEVILMHP